MSKQQFLIKKGLKMSTAENKEIVSNIADAPKKKNAYTVVIDQISEYSFLY